MGIADYVVAFHGLCLHTFKKEFLYFVFLFIRTRRKWNFEYIEERRTLIEKAMREGS